MNYFPYKLFLKDQVKKRMNKMKVKIMKNTPYLPILISILFLNKQMQLKCKSERTVTDKIHHTISYPN